MRQRTSQLRAGPIPADAMTKIGVTATPVTLAFEVLGMPVTKGSWKVGGTRNGRLFLAADNPGEEAWAQQVAWAARQAMRRPPNPAKETRWSADLTFTLEPPPNKGRTNRRDVDKLARSVLDALTGIVWADDEQVVDLHARKFEVGAAGARPRAGVFVKVDPITRT